MNHVDKNELIERISVRTKISQIDIKNMLNVFFDEVESSLKQGKDVSLHGFGKFIVQDVKARKGRNLYNGTEVDIPARKRVKFVPSHDMRFV